MLIDNFAKLNSVSRYSISTVLVVIVTIAVYSWIVAPHVNHLFAVQRYESVVDEAIKKNKIYSSTIGTKKKKLGKLGEQFTQLQSSMFMMNEAKEFFSDLQAISEQAKCTVYSLNLVTNEQNSKDGKPEDSSGIVPKSAILSVIGAYGNIVKLIEKLQSREQKVWIDSVRMSGLGDTSGQIKCDITITICVIQDKEVMPHE